MDACTRQRVNYIAIYIQFIDDQNNLVIHTLAVHDTKAQHSSDYIKKLLKVLYWNMLQKIKF